MLREVTLGVYIPELQETRVQCHSKPRAHPRRPSPSPCVKGENYSGARAIFDDQEAKERSSRLRVTCGEIALGLDRSLARPIAKIGSVWIAERRQFIANALYHV